MRVAIAAATMCLLPSICLPRPVGAAQASLLGRGYTPFLTQVQEVAVTPPQDRAIVGGASNTTQFGLLASQEAFERLIEADMSVSAAKGGWGASLRASLTKDYRNSRKQITFAAVQHIVRGSVGLPSPMRLDSSAARLLQTSPARYLRSYGTSVIESVELGGAAVFLFTFTFASEEEALRSSLNAEGHYGLVKGSLSVSIRELLRRSSNNVTVSGFVTGTTKLPRFFGSTTNGSRPAFYTVKYSESMLQSILTYLDSFPATIASATPAELSQVGFVARPLSNIGSVTLGAAALAEFQAAETFATRIQDVTALIDERRNTLRRMTTIYKRYNTAANIRLATSLDSTLLASANKLVRLRQALADFGAMDEKALERLPIPDVPANFCTTEPTDISPPPFRRLDAGNPKNQASSPPRKWLQFPVTPRLTSVTYTVWVEVSLGHSRTDPGCNAGHAILRVRTRGTPTSADGRELGSWSPRASAGLEPEEDVISDTGEFSVCRGQADQAFSTAPHSFVAGGAHEVRLLYSNWDDIGYTTVAVHALRCGRQ